MVSMRIPLPRTKPRGPVVASLLPTALTPQFLVSVCDAAPPAKPGRPGPRGKLTVPTSANRQ